MIPQHIWQHLTPRRRIERDAPCTVTCSAGTAKLLVTCASDSLQDTQSYDAARSAPSIARKRGRIESGRNGARRTRVGTLRVTRRRPRTSRDSIATGDSAEGGRARQLDAGVLGSHHHKTRPRTGRIAYAL